LFFSFAHEFRQGNSSLVILLTSGLERLAAFGGMVAARSVTIPAAK
jgi:hypothetical protein